MKRNCFASITFSQRICSIKEAVFKNVAKFTGKTCARFSFLIKWHASICNFVRKGSSTGAFLSVLRNFYNNLFYRTIRATYSATAWKVSKYGVISGPYFPVFGLNAEIYGVNNSVRNNGTEITPYSDTFHAVCIIKRFLQIFHGIGRFTHARRTSSIKKMNSTIHSILFSSLLTKGATLAWYIALARYIIKS